MISLLASKYQVGMTVRFLAKNQHNQKKTFVLRQNLDVDFWPKNLFFTTFGLFNNLAHKIHNLSTRLGKSRSEAFFSLKVLETLKGPLRTSKVP